MTHTRKEVNQMKKYDNRKNIGFEVQCYNEQGDYSHVYGCASLEEVARVLIMYGNCHGKGYFPAVFWSGNRLSNRDLGF